MMATRNTLHVEVVTAEHELYNGEAEIVDAPGSEGQLGILPEHAPLLALLGAGPLEIKLHGEDEIIFVSGGFLEVSNNRVTVLADTAEKAEEIDQARAETARRRAEQSLQDARTRSERAEIEAALQRAIFRLKAVELARTRRRR
ncbi:F0F1 ATP synthase subunit epsilon [Dictyobacter arantiisoli]|uniref:ATP synthase epsilon chain n=1 Tax=Dictyobacter arantiisoli TaxID=2014874 RepID=A0A5A5TDC4_9CHLR|nr:F0F1 ATP synthase subunit epsilon [Dictyobacter arantiisoli]GCF09357.1 ATP synthase epsilon chain [Dictyobacter arantiisoli]